jgi:hypothetical protein
MQVGVIAEGKGDHAVIANILKGKLGIDRALITFIQPELYFDETDIQSGGYQQMSAEKFGGWVLVKDCCLERSRIANFMNASDETRIVVIQIDTAEAHHTGYEVERPDKSVDAYSSVLRENVVAKISGWLDGQFSEQVYYAVTIEEIEAWLLPIFGERATETAKFNDPKNRFQSLLNTKLSDKERKKLFQDEPFDRYLKLSKDFRNKKLLEKHCQQNESLLLFCKSLEEVDTSEL